MGKVIGEAEAEVDLSADILQYYADRGEALLEPEKVPVARTRQRARSRS